MVSTTIRILSTAATVWLFLIKGSFAFDCTSNYNASTPIVSQLSTKIDHSTQAFTAATGLASWTASSCQCPVPSMAWSNQTSKLGTHSPTAASLFSTATSSTILVDQSPSPVVTATPALSFTGSGSQFKSSGGFWLFGIGFFCLVEML